MKEAEPVAFSTSLKRSADLFNLSKNVIPGGVTANIKYFDPHPIYMEKGSGSKIYDVDGHEYIDYLLCYGSLITGHGHPDVMMAVQKQMFNSGTTVFGTPHHLETVMAKKLVELYPSIDMVRYTNSGLEATLLAIRIAKAHTGKTKIAKFEGHYHGGYNQVLFSVHPDLDQAGEDHEPASVPESAGIHKDEAQQTIVLPFNHKEGTKKILERHAKELAAIIIEPVQGGFIPADQEFIQLLRKWTEELDIVLIFDEVKTGFRVGLGGAQVHYGIKPDLTALGKVLGGGFPIGAVGGNEEMMKLTDPKADELFARMHRGSGAEHPKVLFHSGTYNGHPIVLAAGLATIELLEDEANYNRILALTNRLRAGLEELYFEYGIQAQTIGLGSIFNLVLTQHPIRSYRDLIHDQSSLRKSIDYMLLSNGIYMKPLNRYSLSLAHTEKDIDRTIQAHREALEKLRK